MSNTLLLQSQTQASNIYSGSGMFPKQKHQFLIRFVGNTGINMSSLTFTAKSMTRPTVTTTVEELNQYNQKRNVYSGYKLQNVDVTFYDSGDGAANTMWANYSRYYFSDFGYSTSDFSPTSIYSDAVTQSSYGFYANGTNQYYFAYIELLHFYNNQYDQYVLVNPRIVDWNPDELDYADSEISTIKASFAYEAILFTPNAGQTSNVPELQQGQPFYGSAGPLDGSAGASLPATAYGIDPFVNGVLDNSLNTVSSLFGAASLAASAAIPPYRYYAAATGAALGAFGNFLFGAPETVAAVSSVAPLTGLASLAVGSPSLAAALNIGAQSAGVSAALASNVTAQVAGAGANPNSGIGAALTAGLIGATVAATATGAVANFGNAVTLSPEGYALINAQGSGASQYGYNTNTNLATGQSYGYNGSAGYLGPSVSPYPPNVPTPALYASQTVATVPTLALSTVVAAESGNIPAALGLSTATAQAVLSTISSQSTGIYPTDEPVISEPGNSDTGSLNTNENTGSDDGGDSTTSYGDQSEAGTDNGSQGNASAGGPSLGSDSGSSGGDGGSNSP